MKITFATTWNDECGIAVYSRSLVAELRKQAEVEIVSLDEPDRGGSPSLLASKLNQGDVAHIQHQYPFFGGMRCYRNTFRRTIVKLNVPLVVTLHEVDLGSTRSRLRGVYKRWFNRRLFCGDEIDRLIVHTAEYRDMLRDLGVVPEDIRVVPEGVPRIEQPAISPEDAKSELGLAGKKVVTIFGFVVRRKGYDVALAALRCLPEDVSLLIAGGRHPDDRTGFRERLVEQIRAEGLSDRVVITGYLPDDRVPLVMTASDVVIAPSSGISNSGSILRAMAHGKPIVASDLPATREINARKECLTLATVGDPADLAEKTRELLENEWKRETAVAAIRSYAETYSVEWAAAQTLAVYKELFARRRT